MTSSSAALRERLTQYAWSAWACLGVAGWKPVAFDACIDIDALVLLTGRLADADARLRDESIDWCVSNLSFVSRSRLANLLRGEEPDAGWSAYAATLQQATRQRWPGAGAAFTWSPSRRSRVPTRADGATLGLRCRALFGATARSEVVRILLLEEPDRPLDARDLAHDAAFTKRSIAEALESLRIAGIVAVGAVGNTHRYQLQRRADLEALLGPLPRIRASQRALCRVQWSILRACETAEHASSGVRRVEGARIVRELGAEIRRVDPRATVLADPAPSLDALEAWVLEATDAVLGRSARAGG